MDEEEWTVYDSSKSRLCLDCTKDIGESQEPMLVVFGRDEWIPILLKFPFCLPVSLSDYSCGDERVGGGQWSVVVLT